ncbi:hypothetical protein PR048_025927 [Dryococelus australis]|uniref:Uncharacterized protein n=1 Tax=Dryococelus australis TaxID=614101 RepID=A0ABQ9GJV9_9NEOP|nr:hypothetical protein PR048_025927 [Dryococelus australis]
MMSSHNKEERRVGIEQERGGDAFVLGLAPRAMATFLEPASACRWLQFQRSRSALRRRIGVSWEMSGGLASSIRRRGNMDRQMGVPSAGSIIAISLRQHKVKAVPAIGACLVSPTHQEDAVSRFGSLDHTSPPPPPQPTLLLGNVLQILPCAPIACRGRSYGSRPTPFASVSARPNYNDPTCRFLSNYSPSARHLVLIQPLELAASDRPPFAWAHRLAGVAILTIPANRNAAEKRSRSKLLMKTVHFERETTAIGTRSKAAVVRWSDCLLPNKEELVRFPKDFRSRESYLAISPVGGNAACYWRGGEETVSANKLKGKKAREEELPRNRNFFLRRKDARLIGIPAVSIQFYFFPDWCERGARRELASVIRNFNVLCPRVLRRWRCLNWRRRIPAGLSVSVMWEGHSVEKGKKKGGGGVGCSRLPRHCSENTSGAVECFSSSGATRCHRQHCFSICHVGVGVAPKSPPSFIIVVRGIARPVVHSVRRAARHDEEYKSFLIQYCWSDDEIGRAYDDLSCISLAVGRRVMRVGAIAKQVGKARRRVRRGVVGNHCPRWRPASRVCTPVKVAPFTRLGVVTSARDHRAAGFRTLSCAWHVLVHYLSERNKHAPPPPQPKTSMCVRRMGRELGGRPNSVSSPTREAPKHLSGYCRHQGCVRAIRTKLTRVPNVPSLLAQGAQNWCAVFLSWCIYLWDSDAIILSVEMFPYGVSTMMVSRFDGIHSALYFPRRVPFHRSKRSGKNTAVRRSEWDDLAKAIPLTTRLPLLRTGFDSHVGIVLDDAVGRPVFSWISRFPRHLHSGVAPHSPRFSVIGSQDTAHSPTLLHDSLYSHRLTRRTFRMLGGKDNLLDGEEPASTLETAITHNPREFPQLYSSSSCWRLRARGHISSSRRGGRAGRVCSILIRASSQLIWDALPGSFISLGVAPPSASLMNCSRQKLGPSAPPSLRQRSCWRRPICTWSLLRSTPPANTSACGSRKPRHPSHEPVTKPDVFSPGRSFPQAGRCNSQMYLCPELAMRWVVFVSPCFSTVAK